MDKLRIAILCDAFPPDPCGGIGTSCFNLARALRGKGCEVKVFTIAGGGESGESREVHRARFPRAVRSFLPRLVSALLEVKERQGVKYQLADTLLGALYAARVGGAVRRFAPDVMVIPDKGISTLLWKPPRGCASVFVSHHNPMRFLGDPLLGAHSVLDARLAVTVQQRTLRRFDGVICPSSYMREEFVRTYSFDGPVAVLGNVADLAAMEEVPPRDLHREYGIPPQTPIVYIPSAGSPIKGARFVPELVRRLAAEHSGSIAFYLSGQIDGDLSRLLERDAGDAVLLMPGRTSYRENIAHLKGCTICLSPTLLENFGMALLEAQFCGLPCISFDVGGNGEIVEHAVTGVLVPRPDLDALVSAANDLLRDRERCRQMGASGSERVARLFGADSGKNYLRFFGEL